MGEGKGARGYAVIGDGVDRDRMQDGGIVGIGRIDRKRSVAGEIQGLERDAMGDVQFEDE